MISEVKKGLYSGCEVCIHSTQFDEVVICEDPKRSGFGAFSPYIYGNQDIKTKVDKSTVKNFNVLDAANKKNVGGAAGLAAAGAALLGPVGLAAGLAAKKKTKYLVQLEWMNGETSLIDIDEVVYKQLLIDLT